MKKQKKFGRKLVVNKETIASLDQKSIRDVRGGLITLVNCSKWCPSVIICPCEEPFTF